MSILMSARGEGVIQAGDREVAVLFTNRALGQAEKQLGRSAVGVVNGGYEKLGISELVIFLQAGMQAARRDNGETGRVTLDDAYQLLDAAGFAPAYLVVVRCISDVIGYSPKESGDEAEGPDPN